MGLLVGAVSQRNHQSTLTHCRIVAIIVGLCFALLFLFVPETFWDRTPRPKHRKHTSSSHRTLSSVVVHALHPKSGHATHDGADDMRKLALDNSAAAARAAPGTIAARRQQKNGLHVGFAPESQPEGSPESPEDAVKPFKLSSLGVDAAPGSTATGISSGDTPHPPGHYESPAITERESPAVASPVSHHDESWRVVPSGNAPKTPGLHSFNSPYYLDVEKDNTDYIKNEHHEPRIATPPMRLLSPEATRTFTPVGEPRTPVEDVMTPTDGTRPMRYTSNLKTQPPKTFAQTLKPWNGRLRNENYFHVAVRPFILFAYPSVLWSTVVYSLSVGWLIVLSESVATIYRSKDTYNFSALGAGLVYLSPFIGGILGTAVAGKVSDIIVRFMARRNGGVYEPEFRLVMAVPIALATSIGLMGFGWSAAERDRWIVPTVFFGIISFGCSLGSTTAITFCVDSYRQYAGEALVTLNFSKSEFLPFRLLAAWVSKLHQSVLMPPRRPPRPRLLPLLQPLA